MRIDDFRRSGKFEDESRGLIATLRSVATKKPLGLTSGWVLALVG
jgi:hypothetical protein